MVCVLRACMCVGGVGVGGVGAWVWGGVVCVRACIKWSLTLNETYKHDNLI